MDYEMGKPGASPSMTALTAQTSLSNPSLDKLGYFDEATGKFKLKEEKKYCGNRFTRRTLIIMIAVGIILLILVAIGAAIPTIGRNIANEAVRDSSIRFDALDITSFTDTSMTMKVKGAVTNPSGMEGTLGSFPLTLSLALTEEDEGQEIGILEMPELTVGGSETPFETVATLTLTNEDNYVKFADQILNSDSFILHMVGKTDLTSGSLTIPDVIFDKYIAMKGMEGFQDVEVIDFDFSQSTTDEIIFVLNVAISNPSEIAIVVGDISLQAFNGDLFMATASIQDFHIKRGTNVVEVRGVLDTTHFSEVIDMLNYYLTGNSLVVTAKVAENGVSSALLYQAMKDWSLVADVPTGDPIVQSVTFEEMTLTPISDFELALEAKVNITLFTPLGPDAALTVHQVSMDLGLYNEAGSRIVQTQIPLSNVQTIPNGINPIVLVDVTTSLVFTENSEKINFVQFIHDFANNPSVLVNLLGSVNTNVNILPLGDVLLEGIVVDTPTVLPGMAGLKDTVIHSVDFGLSSETEIKMSLEVEIMNPSIASMSLGTLSFDIFYDDTRVGYMTTSADFVPGSNLVTIIGHLEPEEGDDEAMEATITLINDYVKGASLNCVARASPNALGNWLLNQGFQGFELVTVVPATTEPLISSVSFSAMSMEPVEGNHDLVSFSATSRIAINSPLGPNGKLVTQSVHLTADLSSAGVSFGSFTTSPDDSSVINSSPSEVNTLLVGALTLANQGAPLVDFVLDFINSPEPTISISVSGTTSVTVLTAIGEITLVDIPVEQSVELAAIGGLPPVSVSEMDLPSNVNDNTYEGINIVTTAHLDNPSIATMSLGGVVMKVYFEDTYQGTLQVDDLTLVPGPNTFVATGVLNPAQDDLNSTGRFFTNYVAGLNSEVELALDAVNPENAAPWLLTVLRNLTLSSTLHTTGNVPLDLISTVTMVGQMKTTLPDVGNPSLGGTANTHFNNPFDFKITVLTYTMAMDVKNNNNELVGTITVPWSVVNTAPGGTNYDLQLSFFAELSVQSRPLLETFIANVLQTTGTNIRISAVASVRASTGAGIIQVDNVPVNTVIPVKGFNSFANNALTVGSITIDKGTSGHLDFFVGLNIVSKSNIDVTLGSAKFDINYNNVYVGFASNTALQMIILGSASGITNSFTFLGTFDQRDGASTTAISAVLSNYLNRFSTTLTLVGSQVPNPSPLQSALATTTVTTSLAGLTTKIVRTIVITSLSSGYMKIDNPTNIPITLTSCNVLVKWSDGNKSNFAAYTKKLGDAVGSNLGTFQPMTSDVSSNNVAVQNTPGLGDLTLIGWALLSDDLRLAISGPVNIQIDSFTATVNVEDFNIYSYFEL